jgi:hypothetical protein
MTSQDLRTTRVGAASREKDDIGLFLDDEDFCLGPVSTESDRWQPRTWGTPGVGAASREMESLSPFVWRSSAWGLSPIRATDGDPGLLLYTEKEMTGRFTMATGPWLTVCSSLCSLCRRGR